MLGRRRRKAPDHQLTLALAWLSEDEFIQELHSRGAHGIRRVRFKANRTRLVSLSKDRHTLNVHMCFQAAPGDVLDAIAAFVRLRESTAEYRAAIARLRAFWEGQTPPELVSLPPRPGRGTPAQTRFLARLYSQLNRTRFRRRLPADLHLRLSDRMSRRFGHVQYGRTRGEERVVEEIALNIDLLMPGNERALVDTLLHEMAHVEAWLEHGHRDHGPAWRRIAERVGCDAHACSHVRIRRRRRSGPPVTNVPVISVPPLPAAARRAKR